MKQLKALREYHGWTQEDLAEELSVSVESVRGWERKSNPIHPGIKNRHKINNLLVAAGIEKILPTQKGVDKLFFDPESILKTADKIIESGDL